MKAVLTLRLPDPRAEAAKGSEQRWIPRVRGVPESRDFRLEGVRTDDRPKPFLEVVASGEQSILLRPRDFWALEHAGGESAIPMPIEAVARRIVSGRESEIRGRLVRRRSTVDENGPGQDPEGPIVDGEGPVRVKIAVKVGREVQATDLADGISERRSTKVRTTVGRIWTDPLTEGRLPVDLRCRRIMAASFRVVAGERIAGGRGRMSVPKDIGNATLVVEEGVPLPVRRIIVGHHRGSHGSSDMKVAWKDYVRSTVVTAAPMKLYRTFIQLHKTKIF